MNTHRLPDCPYTTDISCISIQGNIGDFNVDTDEVPYAELPSFDKYVLKRTALAIDEMRGAYDNYQYALVVSTLQSFVTFLSNVFLDVSKGSCVRLSQHPKTVPPDYSDCLRNTRRERR